MGIARDGEIVRGPFGDSGPGLLKAAEAAEKRKNSGGQQYQEAFEIIARTAVGALVPQYGGQLIGGEREHDFARDDQAGTQHTPEHHQGCGVFHQPDGCGFSTKVSLAGGALAAANMTERPASGAKGAGDGEAPDGHAEDRGGQTDPADGFGGGAGFQPQIAGRDQSSDHQKREARGGEAQQEQQPRGQLRPKPFGEPDGGGRQ